MMRVFGSEAYKLLRPGLLIGGLGTIVAFPLVVVLLVFLNADPASQASDGDGPPLPSIEQLETEDGGVTALAFAGTTIGVVSLVLFAQSVGSEYAYGTLRILLTREPRRLVLLGGKLLAMAAFVAAGVLLAWLAQTLLAVTVASARGIETSAWWSLDGWVEAVGTVLRVYYASIVLGVLGSLLAVALRASAPAIGIGIGYTLVAEQLLLIAWDEGTKWMPGQAISHFSLGGTEALPLERAMLMVSLYGIVFLAAQAAIFFRRDVST